MTNYGGDSLVYQPYRSIGRYWLAIVVLTILAAAAVAGLASVRSASYTSSSTVAWNPDFRADLPALYGPYSSSVQPTLDVATAAIRVRGDAIMSAAGSPIGISPNKLRDETSVSSSQDDDTISISVRASSSQEARRLVNAVTNSFVQSSQRQVVTVLRAQAAQISNALKSVSGDLTAGQTADLRSKQALLSAAAAGTTGPASVVQTATEPIDSRGSVSRNAAIGGALGLVLGVLVALALGARSGRRHARPSNG